MKNKYNKMKNKYITIINRKSERYKSLINKVEDEIDDVSMRLERMN